MNDQPESTCSECGKTYQPDLASGLGGGCPHCLARMLAQDTEDKDAGGDSPPVLAAGDTLGGVEIIAPLAKGGMGVIYKARQPELNRVVAIKVIDAKLAGVPEFTQRFEREARALAVLNHPNVVQVFDYGHEDGLCYLVMEWVDGTSLREILAVGHLSADDALRYVPQICDALEYAHSRGVVHRDPIPRADSRVVALVVFRFVDFPLADPPRLVAPLLVLDPVAPGFRVHAPVAPAIFELEQ